MKLTFLLLLLSYSGIVLGQNPITIPPTIETNIINLSLNQGVTQFYNGINTNTMGANGNLLGPTLILNQGDLVTINVENQLGAPTTIHWHGLHVAPENDGGPHSVIADGGTWSPQFTVMDRAGINWYHPHMHMQTNEHVSKGVAGMILVKDAEEAALNLPREYGIDDFPIIVQTKGFDGSGQIEWMSHLDTTILVNGTIDPYLDAPAQVIRLRVLNGSSQRVYKFGFSNNIPFKLIGTDGSLLEAPVDLTRYQMAPGQRADILVNLSGMQGQSLQLLNYGSEIANAIYGSSQPGMASQLTLPGYSSNPLNGSNFDVLDIHVVAPTSNPVTTIPSSLVSHTILAEGTQDATRTLTMTTQQNIVGPFLINGATFDMNVINYTIPLGNREIWSLTNQTPIAHPFHIHDVQFRILDINGAPPAPELSGLNDVVLVPAGMGTVRFITEFLDFANDMVPYMYHCHMLMHEDDGMMGQFIVSDANASLEDIQSGSLQMSPNPTEGIISIYHENAITGRILLHDMTGKMVNIETQVLNKNEVLLILNHLESGVYTVLFETETGIETGRILKFD